MDARKIIGLLGLSPLPVEGGYYVETYRSGETVSSDALPDRYGRDKAFATAIYYLLTPDAFSAIHRVRSDEIFHFYAGDPVRMLMLHPDGSHELVLLGNDLDSGARPQVAVPQRTWQGCRLVEGGEYALMGTTVAPSFDFDDYEHGDPRVLSRNYPECAEMIWELCRREPR